MTESLEKLSEHALRSCDILVPKSSVDLHRWAVVACDQYTSQPDYWKRVESYVGEHPSTLKLIYPEVYLEEEDHSHRIERINAEMERYLQEELFDHYPDSMFLIERTSSENGHSRWGLLACLDLEHYDYSNGSRTLIRATEGTILDRIPPRKEIRIRASLELPHILVLINDAHRTVIEPLVAQRAGLDKVYSTALMEGGGSVSAWRLNDENTIGHLARTIGVLHDSLDPDNPLLYAMGDGNHSLATAKSCWEDIKATLAQQERSDHPARYALVEIENIYDPALEFEPIHRALFSIDQTLFEREVAKICSAFSRIATSSLEEVEEMINSDDGVQRFGYCDAAGFAVYELTDPIASIAAGSLQHLIDSVTTDTTVTVDYIHGTDVTIALAQETGTIGLILPEVCKSSFFETIIRDNTLPRKTFSMGEAHQKRFYLEARKIR
jgi:hypothetical protein